MEQLDENILKWRLILGKKAEDEDEIAAELGSGDGESLLSDDEKGLDETLNALYDSEKTGGLGSSSPNVNRWLGDIRKYFPATCVRIMQKDAMELLGLEQMLLEPEMLEAVEADINLVGTLMSLNKVIPDKTKDTARAVVRKVVDELEKKLRNPMREAIEGSISRSIPNRRPKFSEINWIKTIQKNLKHYQEDYKTVIPVNLYGYGKKGKALKEVILLVDQSGSMATSVVYAGIFGAVMASLKSLKTHMVVFDTAVVDLTEKIDDPVDLLFGTQLGGGTDINKALSYAQGIIQQPSDTILVLISDLFEGGNKKELIQRIASIKDNGTEIINLLSLNDEGAPVYDKRIAAQIAALNIPSFACSPNQFPQLMAAAIKKEDLNQWWAKQQDLD